MLNADLLVMVGGVCVVVSLLMFKVDNVLCYLEQLPLISHMKDCPISVADHVQVNIGLDSITQRVH